jgi:hypothetical protein
VGAGATVAASGTAVLENGQTSNCTFIGYDVLTRAGEVTPPRDAGPADGNAAGVADAATQPAGLNVMPPIYNFGSVQVRSASAPIVFTIRNTSQRPVQVLPNLGKSVGGFVLVDTNCVEQLAYQASCQARVAFRPTTVGSAEGTLYPSLQSGTPATLVGTGVGDPGDLGDAGVAAEAGISVDGATM